MAKRKKRKDFFRYECTITGQLFQTTREAPSPSELMSVEAYYAMHPDMDDRPENIKLELEQKKQREAEESTPLQ